VERIVIWPGALVATDTVILELSNPEERDFRCWAARRMTAEQATY